MRDDLKDLKLYQAPSSDLVNLANNENYLLDWKKEIKDELVETLLASNLNQYGDSQHSGLINEFAKYLKVQPANVLVTSGSDSLLPMLINVLVTKKVLTVAPDFFRYSQATMICKEIVFKFQ